MKTADRWYILECVNRNELSKEEAEKMIQELEQGDFRQCYAPEDHTDQP